MALVLDWHPMHATVNARLEGETATDTILFCHATQNSFLRLMTTAALFRPNGVPPFTNQGAWKLYEALRVSPAFGFLEVAATIEPAWKKLSNVDSSSPKTWMDTYLASIAITYGITLVTLDQDFRQYKGLAVEVIE